MPIELGSVGTICQVTHVIHVTCVTPPLSCSFAFIKVLVYTLDLPVPVLFHIFSRDSVSLLDSKKAAAANSIVYGAIEFEGASPSMYVNAPLL